VASSTGKARSTIANSLRILSLPTLVLDMLSSGKIEKGHAKLLASMQPNKAEEVAKKIIKEGLTVRDLSNLSLKSKSKLNSRPKQKDTDVLNIEKEMSEIFGHKIEIEAKNTKTGKVSIIYKTLDELDNIISKIKNK
jgi:ParB family chromosome partitioning protein